MLRYVTIPKFSEKSGYTEDAIRTKIRDGVWPENRVWVKAEDGRILIDIEGYYEWVERSRVSRQPAKRQSKSPSPFAENNAVKESSSPLPLLT